VQRLSGSAYIGYITYREGFMLQQTQPTDFTSQQYSRYTLYLYHRPKNICIPPSPIKTQRICTIKKIDPEKYRGGPDPRTPPASYGPDVFPLGGAAGVLALYGIGKGDPDFISVFNSNHTFITHILRNNQVVRRIGVIVLYPLGGTASDSSLQNWKGQPRLYISF
jgi:hypothetical protein